MRRKSRFFVGLLSLASCCLVCATIASGQTEAGSAAKPDLKTTEWTIAKPDTNTESAKKKVVAFKKNGGIEYHRGENFRLTLDVYVPEGEGPFPAILAIHGGAWRSGSKLHLIRHAWMLAGQEYVVVAINYRHAPTHKFPAQIHDCKIAVRWLKKHASEYKIDPDRVGVYGYSAGGHLAALLGTTTADDGLDGEIPDELAPYDASVNTIVIGGAPCEFSWVGEQSTTLAYWLGASRAGNPKIYERASPVNYVDKSDVPTRIYHGDSDFLVPTTTARKFYDTLVAKGVPTELEILDKGHFGAFSDFECFDRAIDFFDRHLKPARPSNQQHKED